MQKTKTAETPKKIIMAECEGRLPVHNVDQLILHQSSLSPSLSNSEGDDELKAKARGFGISLGLKRPETSRGCLVRTPNTQLDDPEHPLYHQDNSLKNGSRWRISKDRAKKEDKREEEEWKKTEEEQRSPSVRNEEKERETTKADRDVEEEREEMERQKEERLCLLRQQLRGKEEEEERKIKEESEERLR